MLYLCWTRETLNDSLDLGSFLDLTTGESLHDESSHDSEHCDEYNIRLPVTEAWCQNFAFLTLASDLLDKEIYERMERILVHYHHNDSWDIAYAVLL